ncbi:MAG: MMPL family transporter [Micrococcales bacterium]
MRTFAKLVTGRAGAWVTVILSFVLIGAIFAAGGKSETATSPGIGLPESAESAKVTALQEKFRSQQGTAALIVFVSETSRIEGEQLRHIRGVSDELKQISELPFAPNAIFSQDRTAALVSLPLKEIEDTKKLTARISQIREVVSKDAPAGLKAYVTGPEGFKADLANVFAGADLKLLITTALVVVLLLLITYRSPILWIVPLVVIGMADGVSGVVARMVASNLGITLDGSVTGILSVLVFGAGTDYALLLISRYREELLVHQNRRDAMRVAYREAVPAIFASAATVILALLTLTFAQLEGTRALGLACAIGVAVAFTIAVTLLPAALVLFGRWIFWPVAPKLGGKDKTANGLWAKLGTGVSKTPRVVAAIGIALLIALASGTAGLKIGLSSTEQFLSKPEAVVGQDVLADKFGAGLGSVTQVVYSTQSDTPLSAELANVPGVGRVLSNQNLGPYTQVNLSLKAEPQSQEAFETVQRIRDKIASLKGSDALVGGQDATQYDVARAYSADQALIIPLILGLVFIVLVLLLRSLVAPVLLLLTVVASFFASLGAGWLLFEHVFHFPGLAQSTYLFSFLFLVALGVDYNIFLVTRAKEESAKLGVRAGMIRALGSTGGVITSAGVLLAAVFAVLGVLPLIALTQIGVIVCIGVLLDTLLVRTVIVPALAFIAGKKFWWPREKGYKA